MNLPKKSVPATEIKNRFGDYLEQVMKKEPLLIERHGKPVAVLVGFSEWQELNGEKPKDEPTDPWIRSYRALMERIKKNHPDAKPFSAVELVRKIREERG